MSARFSKSLITIIIASLFMGVIALPDSVKNNWPDNRFMNFFKDPKITLGLDLQGGTQLDYRIDLKNAYEKNADEDPDNDVRIHDIIEGVRTTIERRVNGLGVSEPQIYLSSIAGEQHIIVELAGIKDIEEAKKTVGKTIQLEFKEPKTEVEKDEREKIDAEAASVLQRVQAEGADFKAIGDVVRTSDKKVDFRAEKTDFVSELPERYKEILPKLTAGKVHNAVIEGSDGYTVSSSGQLTEKQGLFIVQLAEKGVTDRTVKETGTFEDVAKELGVTLEMLENQKRENFDDMEADAIWAVNPNDYKYTDILETEDELIVYQVFSKTEGEKSVRASHILLAYEGANRANSEVTRSKEEALAEAERVAALAQDNPGEFAKFAEEYSDGPSGPKGGDLGFFTHERMAKPFADAAFSMPPGVISDVVETEFGYHIIKVTDEKTAEGSVGVQLLSIGKTDENRTKLTEAMAMTKPHDVIIQEEQFTFNEIFFDLTPDPWKSTGLDGAHFKYATVTYSQLGSPQVSIEFDSEGADMFEDLTERLVNQRLAIFVGGELISAPNVNEKISGGSAVITGNYNLQEAMQMANDLNTGAIDAPIILSGQYTISATLGESALKVSLQAGLIGLIFLAIFMILYYRLMGIFAVFALIIYSIIIVFILKTTGIVITLAGIAGLILSIGMAVDANILIFERTKEELNTGKNFSAAIVVGFERAWSSIRDSNVSSLITCTILWIFGNSIIRGFALMLAIGILVSMFTAITVTRSFLRSTTGTALSKNRFLLGTKKIETINR